jgi:hypothetical protein
VNRDTDRLTELLPKRQDCPPLVRREIVEARAQRNVYQTLFHQHRPQWKGESVAQLNEPIAGRVLRSIEVVLDLRLFLSQAIPSDGISVGLFDRERVRHADARAALEVALVHRAVAVQNVSNVSNRWTTGVVPDVVQQGHRECLSLIGRQSGADQSCTGPDPLGVAVIMEECAAPLEEHSPTPVRNPGSGCARRSAGSPAADVQEVARKAKDSWVTRVADRKLVDQAGQHRVTQQRWQLGFEADGQALG